MLCARMYIWGSPYHSPHRRHAGDHSFLFCVYVREFFKTDENGGSGGESSAFHCSVLVGISLEFGTVRIEDGHGSQNELWPVLLLYSFGADLNRGY